MELLRNLIADNGKVRSLDDLGTKNAREECQQTAFSGVLKMLLTGYDPGNRKESIDKLERIYGETLARVDEYAREITEEPLQKLRQSGEKSLQDFVREAATHPGRIPSTVAECRRLQKFLKDEQELLRAQDRNEERAEEERRQTWSVCQEELRRYRRVRREAAVRAWQDTVNHLVLPAHLARTIKDLIANVLGNLRDRVLEAADWCERATGNVEETIQYLSEEVIPLEASPSPFTRYEDATKVRPGAEARKFLEGLGDAKAWFISDPKETQAAVLKFADQELDLAFRTGGPGSITQLLLADPQNSLHELRRFSSPLWSYSSSEIPAMNIQDVQHIEVLGLDRPSGETQAVLGADLKDPPVETGWWERIVHLQIRAGIPLSTLTCMDEMWRDYARRPSRRHRESFHLDRRWVNWPELPAHNFLPLILGTFAQGFASQQIVRSGGMFEYRNDAHSQALGDNFVRAYEALSRNRQLLQSIADSFRGWRDQSTAMVEIEAKAKELWEILTRDGAQMQDRPLIEALVQCLEDMLP